MNMDVKKIGGQVAHFEKAKQGLNELVTFNTFGCGRLPLQGGKK